MNLDLTKPVKDIVLENPGSAAVFERLNIDYCCGGKISLDEACRTAGVEQEELIRRLESAQRSPLEDGPVTNWNGQSLTALIDYIVSTHHSYCRREITRLDPLLKKVAEKHGPNHPELARLQAAFESLSNDLVMHMMKEERMLFPYIAALEDAVTSRLPLPCPPFGAVKNPVRMMMLEHDQAGDELREMREMTSAYNPPPDACASYRVLYQDLLRFQQDLHEHIHLENNLLFPRAIELEEGVAIAGKA